MILFNKPCVLDAGIRYATEAFASDHHCGDGPFTRKCQAFLEKSLGVPKALLTTSCTHALEMAALLLDLEPGDEVIVPSFTFVSTANAFALRGARIVFCDIRSDTLNIDELQLEARVTSRTRAIALVHYAGVGCEMGAIRNIAERFGLHIIEDNAHGLFGRVGKDWLGTMGTFAALSFHETKNFSCGEGGAILINDSRFVQRAEIIREKGTNRSQFFRGEVKKYTWLDYGSSYLIADILAAALLAQFENAAEIQSRRREIWMKYQEGLTAWAKQHGVRLPHVPAHYEQSWHMFYLLLPTPAARTALLEHLRREQILAVFHYLPLHLSKMGRRFGGKEGDCPVVEDVHARLARLPFHYRLAPQEQDRVIEAICNFQP
jgi:dTDP-4-amino-4,6-dideoxygalactose transaminase